MAPNTYTLRARCADWDAVEGFYSQRVMPGGLLAARVPFVPQPGDRVTVALELPDGLVMAIDGAVRRVGPSRAGKTPIVIRLVGFGERAVARLEAMVADGRAAAAAAGISPPSGRRKGSARPPPPRPEDAPVDIRIEPRAAPDPSTLSPEARAVYDELVRELERMRELGAAAVIGSEPGATLAEVRAAYIELVKSHHPDLLARHRSPAIAGAAEELFIFANRAYDRVRSAARSAGHAAVAGPAMRAELGWVIDVSDLGGGDRPRSLDAADLFGDVDDSAPGDAAVSLAGDEEPRMSMSELVAEAAAADARGDYARAAELFAEALQIAPRDRKLRARYHATRGRQLIARGDRVRATTQLELALSHDPDNRDAAEVLAGMREKPKRRRSRLTRWLRGES